MKRLLTTIIALSLCLSCSKLKLVSPEPSGEELTSIKQGKELVKVNETSIQEGYLELLSKINPRVKSQLANPVTRKKLLENLIEQELLYQESFRRGLHKKEEVIDKAALYRRVIISQAVLEEELEKKSREYYDEKKDSDFAKVSFSQIQIDFKSPTPAAKSDAKDKDKKEAAKKSKEPATEEEKQQALKRAQEIKSRIDSGEEEFAKIAEAVSDDKASRRKGGDMGKISRTDRRMARRGLDALVEAAFKLKKGAISDPIETKKAYHIITVTSDPEVTPYEEAERIIRFQIQKNVKNDVLAELKKKATIVYADTKEVKEEKAETKPKVLEVEKKVVEETKPDKPEPTSEPKAKSPTEKEPPAEEAENTRPKTENVIEPKKASETTGEVAEGEATKPKPAGNQEAKEKGDVSKDTPEPNVNTPVAIKQEKSPPTGQAQPSKTDNVIIPEEKKESSPTNKPEVKSEETAPKPPPPMALRITGSRDSVPNQANADTSTQNAETPPTQEQ